MRPSFPSHPVLAPVLAAVLSVAAGLPAAAAPAAEPEPASAPMSAAERIIFTDPHLAGTRPPMQLHYSFQRIDNEDRSAAFEDRVHLSVAARGDGGCCAVQAKFLTGARTLPLPDLEDAKSNPVTMFFLEREVREMQRVTRGQAAHFRRRIRLALADEAQVRPVQVAYGGRQLDGTEVTITPYLKDPQRNRFEKLAAKQYQFVFSNQVPGGVFSIRSRLPDARSENPPLNEETLQLQPPSPDKKSRS